MLNQSFRFLRPHLYKSLPKSHYSPFVTSYSFCEWRPNTPKYKVHVNLDDYHMAHPIWDTADINNVQITHYEPKKGFDKRALFLARRVRGFFDFVSGYKPGSADEKHYLRRLICIEAISAVPGMIGGMIRHINALSLMRQDKGWIHHLLQQAENERQHLFVLLDIKKPGILFRSGLFMAQATSILLYSLLYFCSWRTAHRFVGYLREESIKVYSSAIKDLDEGKLPNWQKLSAPEPSVEYWHLEPKATLRDVLACIRADEVMHREMNHYFANRDPDEPMPQFDNIYASHTSERYQH